MTRTILSSSLGLVLAGCAGAPCDLQRRDVEVRATAELPTCLEVRTDSCAPPGSSVLTTNRRVVVTVQNGCGTGAVQTVPADLGTGAETLPFDSTSDRTFHCEQSDTDAPSTDELTWPEGEPRAFLVALPEGADELTFSIGVEVGETSHVAAFRVVPIQRYDACPAEPL